MATSDDYGRWTYDELTIGNDLPVRVLTGGMLTTHEDVISRMRAIHGDDNYGRHLYAVKHDGRMYYMDDLRRSETIIERLGLGPFYEPGPVRGNRDYVELLVASGMFGLVLTPVGILLATLYANPLSIVFPATLFPLSSAFSCNMLDLICPSNDAHSESVIVDGSEVATIPNIPLKHLMGYALRHCVPRFLRRRFHEHDGFNDDWTSMDDATAVHGTVITKDMRSASAFVAMTSDKVRDMTEATSVTIDAAAHEESTNGDMSFVIRTIDSLVGTPGDVKSTLITMSEADANGIIRRVRDDDGLRSR